MGLLAHARCVVAADSGPLHLAAALGTPVVGLYGPTDPARNGPFALRSRDRERSTARRDQLQAAERLTRRPCFESASSRSLTRRFPVCRHPRERRDKLLDSLARPRGVSGWHRGILVCKAAIGMADLRSRHRDRGIISAGLRRRASPQTQATGDLGTLRVHAKPSVFGKHAAGRRLFRGQPFVDFHGVAGCVPGRVLSGRDSARADGTEGALRRRICRICVARPGVLAAAFSRDASTEHFSWALYRKNREYEAAIGLAVAMAIL